MRGRDGLSPSSNVKSTSSGSAPGIGLLPSLGCTPSSKKPLGAGSSMPEFDLGCTPSSKKPLGAGRSWMFADLPVGPTGVSEVRQLLCRERPDRLRQIDLVGQRDGRLHGSVRDGRLAPGARPGRGLAALWTRCWRLVAGRARCCRVFLGRAWARRLVAGGARGRRLDGAARRLCRWRRRAARASSRAGPPASAGPGCCAARPARREPVDRSAWSGRPCRRHGSRSGRPGPGDPEACCARARVPPRAPAPAHPGPRRRWPVR